MCTFFLVVAFRDARFLSGLYGRFSYIVGPPMSSIMSTDPRRSIGKLAGVISGSPGASDLLARMCAKTHFDSRPCRVQPTFLFEVSLVQGPRGHSMGGHS